MTSVMSSLWRALLLAVCTSLLAVPAAGTLDISAFEYQRKFNTELDLGDCPRREVRMHRDNGTEVIDERLCNIKYRAPVTHKDRRMKDTRNKIIRGPQDVVNNLGLCGGEAASFLGILYNGDCISIEIASRLMFNEKTLVRAFIGHYRKSLDVLEERTEQQEHQLLGGRERYYSDKIYLKNRSYGTLEVIFVQFRFKSATLAQAAAAVEMGAHDKRMSAYMAEILRRAGEPKSTTVITLSTASKKGYHIRKDSEFARQVRHVQIRELEMEQLNRDIEARRLQPHLQYTFDYFLKSEVTAAFRTQDKKPWEESSLLEVTLRGVVHTVKKYARRCRARPMKQHKACKRVRELRRKMQLTQAAIHSFRSAWHDKTDTERTAFLAKYTHMVNGYSRTTVIKDVQRLIRSIKIQKLNNKIKQNNEIPTESTVIRAERIKDGRPGVRPTRKYMNTRTDKLNRRERKNRRDKKDKKQHRRKGRKGRRRGGRRRDRRPSVTSSAGKLSSRPMADVTTPHVTSRETVHVTSHLTSSVTRDDPRKRRPTTNNNIGTSNVRVLGAKRYMSSRSKVNMSSRSRVSSGSPRVNVVASRVTAVRSRPNPQNVRLTREPPAIRGFRRRPTGVAPRMPPVRLLHRGRIGVMSPTTAVQQPSMSKSPSSLSRSTHILNRSPGTLSRSAISLSRSPSILSRSPTSHGIPTVAAPKPTISESRRPAVNESPLSKTSERQRSTVDESQLSKVNASRRPKINESELSKVNENQMSKVSVARRARLSAQRFASRRHRVRHSRRRPVPPTNNG